ncbi:Multidrug efflux pump subunit AcrB [Saccharicrinis carchari]|uniref:Multidrug efflux pump subunit AcrB n=1 Tax=Saccharicrinis carchari TaxID=1168039 RepID=A0A521AU09_SACCC|nr:efflux RND transporter permease subunit [Saccharicrinis carchari]SMO38100.1 Multidrug efflux pump subunit AcrB [Saccharicrinis carchari]
MIDFGKWALDNSKFVFFMVAALVVGGVFSYNGMSKLEDPEIKVKQAMVVTTYPGASAHEVELELTEPLELSLRSIKGVESVISRSMDDVSIIEVKLKPTVPDEEVEQTWDVLRRKIYDTESALPSGANAPVVKDDFGDVFGMFYAITNDGYTEREMNKYLELLKREVQNIEGVAAVEVYGLQNECINIELLQEKMANLGVHPVEVISTLNGQNEAAYSGYYLSGDHRIRVSVNDRYKNVNDISQLLLQGHEKDQLRLSDIASVTMGIEEPVRNEMYFDGKKAYGFSVAVLSGNDITKLGKETDEKMEHIKESLLPAGIDFHKVFYQPERVEDALNSFLGNLLLSITIVIVVLMFAMGFKSGVIIGVNLFIIVFGTFLVLSNFDGTLQRVSLGAFILAMGMLVDNAIVIIDGILVDKKRGLGRLEALTSVGKKTAMPLLGATLIAILAFYPIFLSPDTAGVYVRDLFIVLAVSLMISWILALTLVPIHAGFSLYRKKRSIGKEKDSKTNISAEDKGAVPEISSEKQEDPFDSPAYKTLRKILAWVLCHKTTSIAVAAILVVASLFSYQFLPQGFFPDMEYNQLYIEYKLPEGTVSGKVKEDLKQLADHLLEREEVTHITTSIGGTPTRYNLVRSIAVPSMSYGELIVDFKSPKAAVQSLAYIQNHLIENYPQAYARVKRYNLMYEKFPVAVEFSGPDPAVLRKLTAQAQEIMNENPNTVLECNNWDPKTSVVVVKYSQPAARSLGLSRKDIAISLLAATEGIPTGVFYEGRDRFNIYMKTVKKPGVPLMDLNNAQVFGMVPPFANLLSKETIMGLMSGAVNEEDIISELLRTVPLSQAVSGIDIEWHEPLVIRSNGQRAMRAQCEPAPGASAQSARESILADIEAIALPPGYHVEWWGEHKASSESTKYLFKNFPLAIILMIAILILLFKDYKKPVIILLCIPLILIGVVFGMLLSGKEFGFVAIVGILGLIGMMIKNGVVLMEEIGEQLSTGKTPMEALLDSSSSRFRPVMMASMTTILGMIPLLGDALFGSLAVTIMGGLLVGTLIILLFIPILYALFFGIKLEKSDKNCGK